MDYSFLQNSAAALIQVQGQTVTLTPPGGTYDIPTGTWTGTASPVVTTGVLLPLSRGLKHMPGTDIQSGDQQLLLPGSIAQPPIDAKALINGLTYTIIEVSPFDPAGTPVYFDCIVRGVQ